MARQGKETGSKDRITKRSIDALRSEAQTQARTLYLRDAELTGFGAVATKTGACSYFIEYRLGGRNTPQKRMTLGKHGALTPEEARTRAKAKLGNVADGKDVAQAKKDEREKLTGATFKGAVERFFEMNDRPGRYWTHKRARLLGNDTAPIHNKQIAAIARSDIQTIMDGVRKRSKAAERLLFVDMRPFFKWAMKRYPLTSNPMADMSSPAPAGVRDRVLSDAEIKAFWTAASELGWPFENVFKLLLLTGQRREEVAAVTWRELDLEACAWTIAKERAKNGKAHTLDLSPQATKLLPLEAREDGPGSAKKANAPVFTTNGRTGVSGFSKVKTRLDARMQEILGEGFEPWRTHDLRRTAASGMAALGFQPHIIERVLNHLSGVQGGLVSVYQRHTYREERKCALLGWGTHVATLVAETSEASNVVRFRA